mmetsp:Transcript_10479/g.14858  ORF Transcript_10479/g.14858 Transcript_10479/m.14858 type:complete len:326 (-) Transcript_10479:348-1325(-)
MFSTNDMFPVSSDGDLLASTSDNFDLNLDFPAMKKETSSSSSQSLSLLNSLMLSIKKGETKLQEALPALSTSLPPKEAPVKIEQEEERKSVKKTAKKSATKKPRKERKWRKPKDKPKRPLSAYNLFFADEREKMVNAANNGTGSRTGGFGGMAKTVAAKWNTLSDIERQPYEAAAKVEKDKYFSALEVWKLKKSREAMQQEQEQPVTSMSSSSVPTVVTSAPAAPMVTTERPSFPSFDEPPRFENNDQQVHDLESILKLSCDLLDQLPGAPTMNTTTSNGMESIFDDTPLEATMGSEDGSDPILDELVACFDAENENNFMKDLQF